MSRWQEQRMSLLYDVQRAAQDLINLKNPSQLHEWRQHGEAWLMLEDAVKRVADHSRNHSVD